MKSLELIKLKSSIEKFAEGKFKDLNKVTLKEYFKILDAHIDRYEDSEKQEYYCGMFRRKPKLKTEALVGYYSELLYIEETIHKALQDYPDFDGIMFSNSYSGKVSINGFHKQISRYFYGNTIEIDKEFNNYINATRQFIEMWKALDNEESVQSKKNFIEAGEKYGWD